MPDFDIGVHDPFGPGELDVAATAAKLAELCPGLEGTIYEVMVEDVVLVVKNADATNWNREGAYLFALCRRLQRNFKRGERAALGRLLAPYGLLQVERLGCAGKLPDCPEWNDRERVLLAFEAAWSKVKFAEDEDLMSEMRRRAMNERILHEPTPLGLFVNFAWQLHKAGDGRPFFLPIGPLLAELFGVSEMTISHYVTVCSSRGYILQRGGYVPKVRARTWVFDESHPDFI